MCDIVLARSTAPAAGSTLFGKNSDRQRNEAQVVERIAGSRFAADDRVSCTFVSIPQARETADVLICRPYWGWGAEMGANAYGVVIANEGLHARSPAPEAPALTGMDLVRLGLERARDAREAAAVITKLLEVHGQGGDCGHLVPNYYNNGFLVADAKEAFVIETVGREWLVEVAPALRALSNAYSIADPTAKSVGLDRLIAEHGWSGAASRDYAATIGNPDREHIGHAGARRARSAALLSARSAQLGILDIFGLLRDHGLGDGFARSWRGQGAASVTLCMHAGAAPRIGQTVGSMASILSADRPVHWVTATAAPCLSIFKPAFVDLPLPGHGPVPGDHCDAESLWWRHELVHRSTLARDLPWAVAAVRKERDALEAGFVDRIETVSRAPAADRAEAMADCWRAAEDWEKRAASLVGARVAATECALPDDDFSVSWAEHDRIAGLELPFAG